MVTITTTRKQNSTIKWDLNKYNRRGASGTANYDLKEKMTVEYEYSCYKCKNGDQGPAKVAETNESEARVEGLSKESTSEGQQVNDARIEMVFFENGTYAVLLEATTRKGSLKVTTEKKVEGMCESESQPRDTKDKEIDIPLKVVLGPSAGTSKDISLHRKKPKICRMVRKKRPLRSISVSHASIIPLQPRSISRPAGFLSNLMPFETLCCHKNLAGMNRIPVSCAPIREQTGFKRMRLCNG